MLKAETPLQAKMRLSFGRIQLLGDNEDAELRSGYPEAAYQAKVVQLGPDCKYVKVGDTVYSLSHRNLKDDMYTIDGETVIIVPENELLAAVISE